MNKTSDYLSIPDSNDFDFSGNDFEAECFIFPKKQVYKTIKKSKEFIFGIDIVK